MTDNTAWMAEAGWGVLVHWLGQKTMSAGEWNARADAFDVDGLVKQLVSIKAPYFFMTVGQNSGHWCSPNATYEKLVGRQPSFCSKRDLMMDIAEALAPHNIKLMAYGISGAPTHDPIATRNLEWEWGFDCEDHVGHGWAKRKGNRLYAFQHKWEAICQEWALRWGNRIHGWWIDGCYFADEMYRHPDAPNFESFTAALKAGNPNAIVAYNPGVYVPVISHTEHEDYTAGEVDLPLAECNGPWIERNGHKARFHVLTHVGERWGSAILQYTDDIASAYTVDTMLNGGCVTWDAHCGKNGLIDERSLAQLGAIGRAASAARKLTDTIERRKTADDARDTWKTAIEGPKWRGDGRDAQAAINALRASPPPSFTIPFVKPTQSGEISWTHAATHQMTRRSADGALLEGRHVSASLLHDGEKLHIRLMEQTDATRLRSTGTWNGDHWEIYFSEKREAPFRQIGISLDQQETLCFGEGKQEWKPASLKIRHSKDTTHWNVLVSMSLKDLCPGGRLPGQVIYVNIFRAGHNFYQHLSLSPAFAGMFCEMPRFCEAMLGPLV